MQHFYISVPYYYYLKVTQIFFFNYKCRLFYYYYLSDKFKNEQITHTLGIFTEVRMFICRYTCIVDVNLGVNEQE